MSPLTLMRFSSRLFLFCQWYQDQFKAMKLLLFQLFLESVLRLQSPDWFWNSTVKTFLFFLFDLLSCSHRVPYFHLDEVNGFMSFLSSSRFMSTDLQDCSPWILFADETVSIVEIMMKPLSTVRLRQLWYLGILKKSMRKLPSTKSSGISSIRAFRMIVLNSTHQGSVNRLESVITTRFARKFPVPGLHCTMWELNEARRCRSRSCSDCED